MSWQIALERMVVGDVWEIVTPPQFAYGHTNNNTHIFTSQYETITPERD